MVKQEDWTGAQASLIGSMLIDPACIGMVMSEIRPEDLTGSYRTMLEAIVDLRIHGQTVDPVTVLDRIGPAYRDEVIRLMRETLTAANVEAYIDVCKEQSRLAQLGAIGMELAGAISLEDAREALQRAQAVAVERASAASVGMITALADFFDRHRKGETKYVSFGFDALDERLNVDLGDVVVLGGYPSDGKTALMLQWAWHIGRELPVGIFSFETSAAKLSDRLFTQAVSELRFTDVKRSNLTVQQWRALTGASLDIGKRRVELIEAAGMTAADVLGVTLSRGFKVIALDYVQLVAPGTVRRGGTRAEEVAEISKALALMARRHGILVIELSQLQRPPRGKNGKIPPPEMSNLRESGQLEQDADVVALLYRIGEAEDAQRELYVAKNKEGRRGRIGLRFDGERQRFSYVAKGSDVPRELELMARRRREAKREGGEQTELPM